MESLTPVSDKDAVTAPRDSTRWVQLLLGVIAMMAISSPQYVWTLFTGPLSAKLGTTLAEIQVTFSLLIVLQTFFSPFQAYLVDRFGPKLLISIGAVMSGGSWVLAAQASSLTALYVTYGVIGGFGTGIIYVGIIGLMVRWFPDRRGFATGLAAAGYGFGAFFTSFPIDSMIKSSGYAYTLLVWGVIQGAIGVAAAVGLRVPPEGYRPTGFDPDIVRTELQSQRSYSPKEMLQNPIFYLLFVMMAMMSTSGLMVVSQMGAFTRDFGLANLIVFGLPVLPLALSVDRITNGLTRPFFGWVSDRIGRENTMTIAFALEGAAMTAWLLTRESPVLFVLLSGVVFFGWGEIFSLFPSTLTDTYGPKHATTNYGLLYMAQGVGSVLGGPLAAILHDRTQSWIPVFQVIIAMDFMTAILAQLLLKPMRRRWFMQTHVAADRKETHAAVPRAVATAP